MSNFEMSTTKRVPLYKVDVPLDQKKHYRDAISGNDFVPFECDCEICQKINRLRDRGTTDEK